MQPHARSTAATRRTRHKNSMRCYASRRGVTAILAMMFLIMFGSLTAAMAIVSRGNLHTAQTHRSVTSAMGAVDTGIAIAASRLAEACYRLRVEKGDIHASYAESLWYGSYSQSDGSVRNPTGDLSSDGIRDILSVLHGADRVVATTNAPRAIPYEFAANHARWFESQAILIEHDGTGSKPLPVSAVKIAYEPVTSVPGEFRVRAIITGYAWDWIGGVDTGGRWITRTASQEFRIFKRVDHAVFGPNKIMIGKNVLIEGPLGARFDVAALSANRQSYEDLHPLVVYSDFYGLSDSLDRKLDAFYDYLSGKDVNNDNRIATRHSTEGSGLGSIPGDYQNASGTSDDTPFDDITRDGVVDEFDIFLGHYDADGDGSVVYDAAAGTIEFNADLDMAKLIDSAAQDRNRNGLLEDGIENPSEADKNLGYNDGKLDRLDRYAKIRGSVYVRIDKDDWELVETESGAVGDFKKYLQGAIRPSNEEPPVVFGATDQELPPVDHSTFTASAAAMAAAADGAAFGSQLASHGFAYTAPIDPDNDGTVKRVTPAVTLNGTPMPNVIEATPFGSPSPADYYERPHFQGADATDAGRDVVFTDVTIPAGVNALFENCTFVGVTRIQTHADNTHESWQNYGKQDSIGQLMYPDNGLDTTAIDNAWTLPPGFVIPVIMGSIDRLQVNGLDYINTKPLSNNIRFHNCTFIGAIVADKPTYYTHVRNKIQFTGACKFLKEHPTDTTLKPEGSDLDMISRSNMMLPHYSVDIGENNADPNQDVRLRGLIIAGVLDIRGKTSIDGALLTTFAPSPADPALMQYGNRVGNPASFNLTLGYFNADQGDNEGLAPFDHLGTMVVGFDTDADGYADTTDPSSGGTPVDFNGYGQITLRWNPNMPMPDGLLAPLQTEALDRTYREGKAQ